MDVTFFKRIYLNVLLLSLCLSQVPQKLRPRFGLSGKCVPEVQRRGVRQHLSATKNEKLLRKFPKKKNN